MINGRKRTIATTNIPAAMTNHVVHEALQEKPILVVANLDITLVAHPQTTAAGTAPNPAHAPVEVTARAIAHPLLVAATAAALEALRG